MLLFFYAFTNTATNFDIIRSYYSDDRNTNRSCCNGLIQR